MAVLRNNIAKVWKMVREEQKIAKAQNKKQDVVYIDGLDNVKNPKQINKDISKFVED